MNKQTIYIVLTLLKVVIIILGMVYLFLNVITWRRTKDAKKLKKSNSYIRRDFSIDSDAYRNRVYYFT